MGDLSNGFRIRSAECLPKTHTWVSDLVVWQRFVIRTFSLSQLEGIPERNLGLKLEGHRSVVDQGDFHIRAETPGGDFKPFAFQCFNELQVNGFTQFW